MRAATAISMLDRQIAAHGSPVTLIRRVSGAADIEWTAKGFVTDLKPREITDGIGQGARRLVLPPSLLAGSAFEAGPKRGDFVVYMGRKLAVEACEPVVVAGVIVRFNVTVAG